MVILKGVRQPASLHTSRFMVQKFAQELENAREDASYGVSLKIDNGNLSCQGKDLPSPLKERLGGALKIISFLKNSDPRLNDLYLRINENPCLSVELTSRLERLGCASINLIMLHHIIHSRAPPLIAELTIAEEILHYYYPEDYYETKADDFVHRIIDAYIASPGIYSIFKEELIVSQNNGISPQREWLEMLGLLAGYPDLGSPDESLLFGIKIKEWARIHGLFLSGAGQIYYRTDEFSEKDRRRYVNAKYPLSPKKIREEILGAAAMVGKEEETREVLTRRSTRKQLYPLLLWAAKIIIPTYGKKEEQKERLFGNPEFDGEYWKGYWNTISRGKLSFLPWKKEDGTINLHLFRDLLRAKEFHPPCIEYYKADKISIGEIYVLMRDFGSPACPCELDILPENKKGPSFGTTLNSFAFLPLAAMFDYSGVILCAALLILLTLTYVRSINQAAAYKKEKKNSWMVIIAAGGKGVRFDSTVNFPKPVHPVNGKPLIRYLIDVARKINIPSIVILDFGAPAIKAFLPGDVKWVMGSNYFNGRFSGPVERFMAGRHLLSGFRGNIILAPADIVIVSDNIIRELQKTHNPAGGKTAWCTILTTEKDDPEGKVRIIRDENNQLSGFISQTWANRQPSSIREVETGIVAVNWKIYKAMQILFLVVEPLIKFLYQTERVRNREDLDGAINKIFNYLARVLWRIGRLRIVKTSDPIGVLNINTREDAKLAEARLKEESIPAGYTPLAREYSREDIVKIWLAKVRLTQLAKGWCWRVYSTSELDCVVKVPREGLRDLAVIAANSYNKTFTIPDYAPVIKQKLGCSIADYFEIRDLKLNLNGKEVFLKRAIVQEKAAIAEQLIRRYLKEGKPQQAREVLRQCITAERRVWAAGLYHSLMDAFWFSRNLGIVESGEMVLVDGGGLFARKPARIEHFLFNNIFVPLSLSRISLSLSAQYLKEALSGSLTYDALNNIWAGKQKVQGGWMNISQLADCLNNDDYERMICQLKDLAGLSFAERIFADNWMPYLQAKAPPYQVNNLLARILVCNELSALHKASHEIFVKSNSGLVWDVLKRYAYLASPGMDVDDLFQEGSIGMLTAINKFDPRRGIRFSTYAVWWIKQAILRALNRSATVKSPEYFNNLERKIRKFIHRYEDKFGEEPLIEEIAGFMGMEADEVKKILGKRPVTFSIDEAVHGSENEPGQITRKDLLKDDSRQVEIEKMFQSSFLDGLLDQIPQQEREVVLLHYLEGKTLSEIGRMLNFSRERARQIKDAAMEKLSCLAEESPVCGLNVVIKARPRLALLKALSLLSSNSVRGVSTGKLISLITSLDLKENEGFALKPYIQFECSTGNRPRDARVVIFDWDDTLFNGVPWFELMYHLAISSIYPGATPDEKQAGYVREYLRNAAGAPFTRHLEWIQEQAASRGIKDNRTIEEHRRIFLCAVRKYIDAQHWKEQPPLLPGAKDLIIALRNKGIRLFVVSGTEHEQLRAEVEATGLTGYFDGIFGDGAFVNFNKPEAIRRIKGALNGDQVVVIGDGRHDIEAAKQAGAIAIGKINDEREKEVLINAGADCTVHDFSRSKSYLLRLLLTKSRIKKTSGGQEGAAPVAGLSAVAPAVFMYPAEQIQPVLLALLITGLVCASVIFIARNCIFSGKYAYLVKDARSLKKFLRERKRNVLSCHEGVFLGKGNYKINDYFGHKDPDLDGSIPQILKAEHDQKISAGKNIEVFPFIKDGLCPGARYLFKNCGIEEKDLIIYSEDSAIKALIQGIAGASEFVRNRLSMSLFDHFKPESEELEQLHIASTIDHHLSRVSCTSTLVAKVFRDTGVRISPSRAYLLVGGIYSDLDASLCSFNRSGFTLESTIAIDDDAEVIYWLNQIAGIKNAPEFLRELSRYEHITADSPAKDLLWDYKVFGNFSIGQDKVGADSRLTPCQLSQIREFMLQESSTRKLQAVAWMLTPMKCEEYGSSIIMRAGPSAVQSFLNVTRNSEHTRRQAIRGLFVKPVIKECLCRGHNRSAVRVIDNAIRGLECFLENKMSGEQYRMFIRMAGSYLKNNLELLHHSRASHKVTPEIEKYLKILDLNLDMAKIIKSRKIGDNFYQIDSFPAMGSRKNDIQLQLKEALRAAGKDDLQKKERRPGVLNDRSGHVLVMILPMILLLLVPVIAGVILLARSAGGMGLYVLLMLFAYVWQFYASCIWGEGKKRVAPSDAKERNAIRDQEEVPLKEAYRLCKKQETQGTERAFTLYINKDLANSVSSRDLEELKRILGSNQPAHKYNRSGQMFVQDPFRDARRQRITHLQIKGIVFDQRCALNEFSREMRRTMAYSPGDDKIGMVKVNPSAEGTMFLESALNEFLQTCDAYGSDPLARKLTVKAPIGWGEFTGVQFNGERLGFVVLGFEMGRNQRTGAERNSRVFLEKYGWAMRHLHDTGFIHSYLHLGNISLMTLPIVIHDLEGAMNRRRDRLDERSFLANRIIDLCYIYRWNKFADNAEMASSFLRGYFGPLPPDKLKDIQDDLTALNTILYKGGPVKAEELNNSLTDRLRTAAAVKKNLLSMIGSSLSRISAPALSQAQEKRFNFLSRAPPVLRSLLTFFLVPAFLNFNFSNALAFQSNIANVIATTNQEVSKSIPIEIGVHQKRPAKKNVGSVLSSLGYSDGNIAKIKKQMHKVFTIMYGQGKVNITEFQKQMSSINADDPEALAGILQSWLERINDPECYFYIGGEMEELFKMFYRGLDNDGDIVEAINENKEIHPFGKSRIIQWLLACSTKNQLAYILLTSQGLKPLGASGIGHAFNVIPFPNSYLIVDFDYGFARNADRKYYEEKSGILILKPKEGIENADEELYKALRQNYAVMNILTCRDCGLNNFLHGNMGEWYYRLKDYQRCIDHYEAMLQLGYRGEVLPYLYLNKGRSYYYLGKLSESRDDLIKSRELYEAILTDYSQNLFVYQEIYSLPEVYVNLSLCCYYLGDDEGALRAMKKASALGGEYVDSRGNDIPEGLKKLLAGPVPAAKSAALSLFSLPQGNELRRYVKETYKVDIVEKDVSLDDSEIRILIQVLSSLPEKIFNNFKEVKVVREIDGGAIARVDEKIDSSRIEIKAWSDEELGNKKPFRFDKMKSLASVPRVFARMMSHEIAHTYHLNAPEDFDKKFKALSEESRGNFENFARTYGGWDYHEDFATLTDMWFDDSQALLSRAIYNSAHGAPLLLKKVLILVDIMVQDNAVYMYKLSASKKGLSISKNKVPIVRDMTGVICGIGPYTNLDHASASAQALLHCPEDDKRIAVSKGAKFILAGDAVYKLTADKGYEFFCGLKTPRSDEENCWWFIQYPRNIFIEGPGQDFLQREFLSKLELFDALSGRSIVKVDLRDKQIRNAALVDICMDKDAQSSVWITDTNNKGPYGQVLLFMDLKGNIKDRLPLNNLTDQKNSNCFAFGSNGRQALLALADNSNFDDFRHTLLLFDIKEQKLIRNLGDKIIPAEIKRYRYPRQILLSDDSRFAYMIYSYSLSEFSDEEYLIAADLRTDKVLYYICNESFRDYRNRFSQSGGNFQKIMLDEEGGYIVLWNRPEGIYLLDRDTGNTVDILMAGEPVADVCLEGRKIYYTLANRDGVFCESLPEKEDSRIASSGEHQADPQPKFRVGALNVFAQLMLACLVFVLSSLLQLPLMVSLAAAFYFFNPLLLADLHEQGYFASPLALERGILEGLFEPLFLEAQVIKDDYAAGLKDQREAGRVRACAVVFNPSLTGSRLMEYDFISNRIEVGRGFFNSSNIEVLRMRLRKIFLHELAHINQRRGPPARTVLNEALLSSQRSRYLTFPSDLACAYLFFTVEKLRNSRLAGAIRSKAAGDDNMLVKTDGTRTGTRVYTFVATKPRHLWRGWSLATQVFHKETMGFSPRSIHYEKSPGKK
ncbi:MAG: HAD-IA family hydrolase [Candidatus Omnitrophota bacterium]